MLPVCPGDHMTLSHVNAGYRTQLSLRQVLGNLLKAVKFVKETTLTVRTAPLKTTYILCLKS